MVRGNAFATTRHGIVLLLLALASAAAFADEDCTPTGNREYGPWEYVCALPTGPDAAGGAAVSTNVIVPGFLWKRTVRTEYQCCQGAQKRTFWLDGGIQYWQRPPRAGADVPTEGQAWVGPPHPPPAPPTPAENDDMKKAGVPHKDGWWQTPPGSIVAGDPPSDADLSIAPVEWPRPPIVPRARCGQWVKAGDKTIPWSELTSEPGHTVEITPTEPPVPVVPWERQYDRCCSRLKPEELEPVIRVRHACLQKVAGNNYLSLELTVTHTCGVEHEPSIEEYVVDPPGLNIKVPKTPSRFKTRSFGSGEGKHWEVTWDRQQVAHSIHLTDKVGIIAVVKATSNCGITVVKSVPITKTCP